jgi:hypothetical protein
MFRNWIYGIGVCLLLSVGALKVQLNSIDAAVAINPTAVQLAQADPCRGRRC